MNWFYYDNNGIKQGPVDSTKLKTLAQHGIIKSDTLLETDTGKTATANQVKGLSLQDTGAAVTVSVPNLADGTFSEVKTVRVSSDNMLTPPCPDCGKPVSKTASQCPQCGHSFIPPRIGPFFISVLFIPGLGHYIQGRNRTGAAFLIIWVIVCSAIWFLSEAIATEGMADVFTIYICLYSLLGFPIALLAGINCVLYKPKR